MHRNDVLELHVALWTVSQPNSKIFMIVVCLVSFHKIHIWRFMISKFLLWWSTRELKGFPDPLITLYLIYKPVVFLIMAYSPPYGIYCLEIS